MAGGSSAGVRVRETLRPRGRPSRWAAGGPPIQIGSSFVPRWSLDGRSVFIGLAGGFPPHVIPLPPGESLPRIPAGGFHSDEEIARLPGARRINASGVVPGSSPDV